MQLDRLRTTQSPSRRNGHDGGSEARISELEKELDKLVEEDKREKEEKREKESEEREKKSEGKKEEGG